jgi:uroporphyrinogen decarboxylase
MYNTKPDFGRVIAAMDHRESDRVPLFEGGIAPEIMTGFLGRVVTKDDLAAQVEFYAVAGYESWSLDRLAWIQTEEDIDSFPWEEAAKLDLSRLYEVQRYLRPGMKITASSGKIFTLPWMLMGFENYCMNTILQPGLVRKLIARVAQIQLDCLRQVVKIPNIAAVWAVDDLAFGTGPMLKPQTFRDFVFPWYEEFASICHEHGIYLIFHSDGKLWELIDDLIAIGIDALHPIDPTCMDIEEVKRIYGDRLCLIGNVSNELLANGTPSEVAEITKRRLEVLGPGGGYCVGSGNSVPNWAKIENYRAMVETVLTYGRYPICID